MLRLCRLQKVSQRIGQSAVASLDLHRKPGLAVPHHQEINFPLEFVAQVTKFEGLESEVGPTFDGFEQMAGYEGLGLLTGIGDARPIAQEPFWLLAQRFGHVGKPRAYDETVMQPLEDIHPSPRRIDAYVHFS